MSISIAVQLCSVEDCDQPRRKREWCGKHYQAWRRHGDPAVTRWTWADRAGRCVSCGSESLMEGSRRYCSKSCSVAVSREARGELILSAGCRGCGDAIDLRRHDGRETRKRSTTWCSDCQPQIQKHGVSAKVIARRDGDRCAECRKPVDLTLTAPNPFSPTIDRIVAAARGGSNDPSNFQLMHRRCNQKKGDLTPEERQIATCTAEGCERRLCSRAMGLCLRHMAPYYRGRLPYPPELRGPKAYRKVT